VHDELGGGPEAVGEVEGSEIGVAEEADGLNVGELGEETREQVCAEAVALVGGKHGDILDVGAEGAVGEGTGETDEGGAIPGGDGRAGGEGLGDGGCRAVGPPAEEIV